MSQRKVIQLIVHPSARGPELFALCDDGSMWRHKEDFNGYVYSRSWLPLEDVPQGSAR